MGKRTLDLIWKAVLVSTAVFCLSIAAVAETRLFVPQFRFSDNEDTQFLIANANDRDVSVDLWAFTSEGEFLGQIQMPVKAHGTRAVTLGEAFQLKGSTVAGWVGATSPDDGVQLTYMRLGGGTEQFEAQTWVSKEMSLALMDSGKQLLRVSNPNAFPTTFTVRGADSVGAFVGVQEFSVDAFGQIEIPPASFFGGRAAQLHLQANGEVLAVIDRMEKPPLRNPRTAAGSREVDEDHLALVIDSEESIGAYQITLSFDPRAIQFSPKDIEGGLIEGFESKPLVVNIDNVAGQMTLGSFQVGARPTGRNAVARMRVAHKTGFPARFGLRIDEVTDTDGHSLSPSSISVGMVRIGR